MTTRTTLAAALFFLATPVLAADHADAPGTQADPAADINDVYTFMNPSDANELVLVVTAIPFADATTRFSDQVDYRLHIENGAGTAFVIECTFDANAAQTLTCVGPGGETAHGALGAVHATASGRMRAFAGLRDDPFFFDLQAFRDTLTDGVPRFTDPGTNFFATLNTMAIVIGLDKSLVDGGGAAPVLKVYASTHRSGS